MSEMEGEKAELKEIVDKPPSQEPIPVTKNPWYKDIRKRLNTYLDEVVATAEKEDPTKLNFIKKAVRSAKIKLLSNPKEGLKVSEKDANFFAKLFKRLVPETRNHKLATLFIIIAGLFTSMGILIHLHRTHHIIPKRKSHNHKNY